MTSADAIGCCLRSWRERVDPRDAGLPVSGRRRVSGLRREEVAGLAGVSLDYLARLEQGRAAHPSPSVLASLARALRVSDEERDHLFRLAGYAEPRAGTVNRHLTAGVQRMLDRLGDVPVVVADVTWQVVAVNPPARALLGETAAGLRDVDARGHNIAWRHFTGESSRVIRNADERARVEAEMVADLHAALGRHPADEPLAALISGLRAVSPRFVELWDTRPVKPRAASRKTFRHPEVGQITLDCDVLEVADSDLRLIVYTAAAGSPDADALALLGAIGAQTFAPG